MSVVKVIELMSESKTSWEDAANKAIAQASKTIKGIKSAYVQDQSCVVDDGKVVAYRVNLKVSFAINN